MGSGGNHRSCACKASTLWPESSLKAHTAGFFYVIICVYMCMSMYEVMGIVSFPGKQAIVS